jgi:hypothetical protein
MVPTAAHGPAEPRAATHPPDGQKRFTIVVDGANAAELVQTWSDLCQVRDQPPSPEFRAVYPYLTTVQGNRFRFRGGDPVTIRENLLKLFQQQQVGGSIRTHVER